MDMIWRILILFLFGELCASQTVDQQNARHSCTAPLLAVDEYIRSTLIIDDLNINVSAFDHMLVQTSEFLYPTLKTGFDLVTKYMSTLTDYQSTWEECVLFLKDITQFVNDHSLPYCSDMITVGEKWRRQNDRVEKIIQWSSISFPTLYACFLSDDPECECPSGQQYVLSANHQRRQPGDFKDRFDYLNGQYFELRTAYNLSQPMVDLLSLMVQWIMSLKSMNFQFDTDVLASLTEHYEPILSALKDTPYKLKGIYDDLKNIEYHIGEVNLGTSTFNDLLDVYVLIDTRKDQLTEINTFLSTSVDNLRNIANNVRRNVQTDIRWAEIAVPSEESFESTLRESLLDHAEAVDGVVKSLDFNRNILNNSVTFIDTHERKDYEIPLARSKAIFETMIQYDLIALRFLECTKQSIDIGRAMSILHESRAERNPTYVNNSSAVDRFIQRNKNLLTEIEKFLEPQRLEALRFSQYYQSLDDSSIENPYGDDTNTTLPTAIKVLFDIFIEKIEIFFNLQCTLDKSILRETLVKEFESDNESSYYGLFTEDNEVKSAITQNGTSNLFGLMMFSIISFDLKLTPLFDQYGELLVAYTKLYETSFDSTDRPLRLREALNTLTSVENELVRLNVDADKLSLAEYIGPKAMNYFFLDFPVGPAVNFSQYGSVTRSSEYFPYLYLAESKIGLFDGNLDRLTNLHPVADKSTVADYATHLEDVSVYSYSDDGFVFEWPVCGIHCMYSLTFSGIQDAHVAFGFGSSYVLDQETLLTGFYVYSPTTPKEDNLSVVMELDIPTKTMNVYYVDGYRRIVKYDIDVTHYIRTVKVNVNGTDIPNTSFSINETMFKLVIAASGLLNFEWHTMEDAIVHLPDPPIDTFLYDAYKGKTPAPHEKFIYVRKGAISQKTFFMLPLEVNRDCLALGVAIASVDQYANDIVNVIQYDGKVVVHNANYSCLRPLRKKRPSHLYMSYEAINNEVSGESKLEILFFSSQSSKGFKLFLPNSEYLPSYIHVTNDSTEIYDNNVLLNGSSYQLNQPSKFDVLCKDDSYCRPEDTGADNLTCEHKGVCSESRLSCSVSADCAEQDTCLSAMTWMFGVCKRS